MRTSKRIVVISSAVALLLISGIVIYATIHRDIIRCYLIRRSNLDKPAPNIYVDPALSAHQQQKLLSSLKEAQERLASLYGEVTANPIIIGGNSMEVMETYGGNSYNQSGRSYLTLTNSFIILGPDGIFSVDVLAHELSHVELAARTGPWRRSKIPNWFDEGLALQLDDRYSETEWLSVTDNGRTAPDLNELGRILHNDWLAYATAKHEVKRFLDLVGQEGLNELLLAIRNGDDFQEAYNRIELAYINVQQ